MQTTPKADRARALRRLFEQHTTSLGRDAAKRKMDKDLGPEWSVMVLEFPGTEDSPKGPPEFKAKPILDAEGTSPEAYPEDTDHCSEPANPKELCRRLRQLAEDIENLLGEDESEEADEDSDAEEQD